MRAGPDISVLDPRKGVNDRAVGDLRIPADDDIGLERDVPSELRPGGQKHRFGRDQRRAAGHRRLTQPFLRDALRLRELGPIVDAEHFALFREDDARLEPTAPRQRHNVGQVIFALGVLGADLLQQLQGAPSVDRHEAGVAKVFVAFSFARLLLLPDGDERAARVAQQAAIAVGVGCEKPENRHGRAFCERGAQRGDRRRSDERRVGE